MGGVFSDRQLSGRAGVEIAHGEELSKLAKKIIVILSVNRTVNGLC